MNILKYPKPASPAGIVALTLGVSALAWAIVPSIFTVTLPRDTLEALYWGLGETLTTPKHPPLSALILNVTSVAFGNRMFPTYALGPLFILAALASIYWLGRELISPAAGLLMIVLSSAGFVLFPMGYEFNPNTAQLPFCAALPVLTWVATRDNKLNQWIFVGAAAGLALLAKYSSAIILISCAVAILATRSGRKRIVTKGPWLALLVCIAITLPHIIASSTQSFQPMGWAIRDLSKPDSINPSTRFLHIGSFILELIAVSLGSIVLLIQSRRMQTKSPEQVRQLNNDGRTYLLLVSGLPFIMILLSGMIGLELRLHWAIMATPLLGPLAVALSPNIISVLENDQVREKLFRNWHIILTAELVLFSAYFGLSPILAPMFSKDPSPIRELINGPAVANIAENYWSEQASSRLYIVTDTGSNSYNRQITGSISFFSRQRPFVYADESITPTGNPEEIQHIKHAISKNWTWIDFEEIAKHGALVVGISDQPDITRRFGLCPIAVKRYDVPLSNPNFKLPPLWLAYLDPKTANLPTCPP